MIVTKLLAKATGFIKLLPVLFFLLPVFSVHAFISGEIVYSSFDRLYTEQEMTEETIILFAGLEAPIPQYQVEVYWIRFLSIGPDDSPTEITAQLFVPLLPEREEVPVYVFAPGSTGLIDACRVSREHTVGIHWGLYRTHLLALAGQGIIGILPDYMGFGLSDMLQPFFCAKAEGRMMLDAARCVEAFFLKDTKAARPGAVFLAGFSQGGHAAFAAADLQSEYATEIVIDGVIGYGPTTDIETLFRQFPVVAPMVVYTFSKKYGIDRFNPADILAQRWLTNLEYDVTRQCIGGMQSYYPWVPQEVFTKSFSEALLNGRLEQEYPFIAHALKENSTGLSGHLLPVLILQGMQDPVVSPDAQRRFFDALSLRDSPGTLILYGNSRHDTRQIAFFDVIEWMRSVTGSTWPVVTRGIIQKE